MSNLLEIYDLMEWSDPQDSRNFWAAAKQNKIDETSFYRAYKDELRKLGLEDLIGTDMSEATYHILKEKSSYGRIKKASEEYPDSWAVKALLKLWVLQFKDGVKSEYQIKKEEAIARREAAQKITVELEALKPQVEAIVNKVGLDFAKKHIDDLINRIEKANKLADEIDALSRGTIFTINLKVSKPISEADDKLFKAAYYVEDVPGDIAGRNSKPGHIIIKILSLIDESTEYHFGRNQRNTCAVSFDDIKNDRIESILLELLEEMLPTVINQRAGSEEILDKYQQEFNELSHKIELSKQAQASVDVNKPVDPDFIATIIADFKAGKKKADDNYHSWASWKYDDGDSGAAYAMEQNKTCDRVAPYFFHCNWRSYVGEREIARCYFKDGDKSLEAALIATFNAVCPELNIEILK